MQAVNMLITPSKLKETENAKPYCKCSPQRDPMSLVEQGKICSCGEDVKVYEWHWQQPEGNGESCVALEDNQKLVTFHPSYSSGTAAVRGDTAFVRDKHYYWEIKMLTDTYGTDIMVGIGTEKVNIEDSRFKFSSLLGEDDQSYGLSYRGNVRHGVASASENDGFCRGSIVGVRVDMWLGTLEFYLNRKPQGISFNDLRQHQQLYPIVCSTAAQSAMRLIYAASWRASLLVDAAKILSAANNDFREKIPPGLQAVLGQHFWLVRPNEDSAAENTEPEEEPEKDDTMLVGLGENRVSVPKTPLSMMILEIYGPKYFPCT